MTHENRIALEKALDDFETKREEKEVKNMTDIEADVYLRDILPSYFNRKYHLRAIIMARKVLKERNNIMKQSISKCHLTWQYENHGMENGMCAGLRTMGDDGEPCSECKECKLNYLYEEEHK